ncbi:hypothetical protein ACFE6N_22320 [Pedobacter sp. BG31]|uniref:hypothetical protein n=1 Tax=Pedobacter sp. BG31 TaxID=3349697 RepID=UPI0035F46CDC
MKTELIKYLAAFSLLLSACATLKSKKVLHEQHLEVKHNSRESSIEQSWAKSNTLLLDTSNSEYVVQITPLGKFFYSAEKGFEGMAEKVVIKGKANNRRMLQGQQQKGRQLQVRNVNSGSTNLKTKLQQFDKSWKPPPGLLGVGALLLLGLVYWIWRKWRLIKN